MLYDKPTAYLKIKSLISIFNSFDNYFISDIKNKELILKLTLRLIEDDLNLARRTNFDNFN